MRIRNCDSSRNELFLRNIYARGPFQGHGFVCPPQFAGIADHPDYDFTISDKPVENWVPWVVEYYERQVCMTTKLGDDAVPRAILPTGTHIYAAAFGCEVHRFPDDPACALPLVRTAEEADKLTTPDIWKSPTLYRIFEFAHAVQKALGKDVSHSLPFFAALFSHGPDPRRRQGLRSAPGNSGHGIP